MKRYRVFYSLPAYRYVEVEARNEESARKKAGKINEPEELFDYEIDWDANEEFGFIVQVSP